MVFELIPIKNLLSNQIYFSGYFQHDTLLTSANKDSINETFWRIQPLFLLVMNGQTEELRSTLNLQLDRYGKSRI